MSLTQLFIIFLDFYESREKSAEHVSDFAGFQDLTRRAPGVGGV